MAMAVASLPYGLWQPDLMIGIALGAVATLAFGVVVALGEPALRKRRAAAIAAVVASPAIAILASYLAAPTRIIGHIELLFAGPVLAGGLVALFRRRREDPSHRRADAGLALLTGAVFAAIAVGLELMLWIAAIDVRWRSGPPSALDLEAASALLGLSLFAAVDLAPALARRWGLC
jgi:hypothetical protein